MKRRKRLDKRARAQFEQRCDAPVEPAYRGKIEFLARYMDHLFNGDLRGQERNVGFALVVFPYNYDASSQSEYISNGADRSAVAELLQAGTG